MFGQYNTKVTTVESRATTTLTLIENIVYLTVKTSCYARKEKKSYTFINTIKYSSFQIHLHFKSDIYSTKYKYHYSFCEVSCTAKNPANCCIFVYSSFCALHYAKHQQAHLLFQVKTLFFSCKQSM